MDCEREGCGHPLAFHDPCNKCDCAGYQPAARKERVARLTDPQPRPAPIREIRRREKEALS